MSADLRERIAEAVRSHAVAVGHPDVEVDSRMVERIEEAVQGRPGPGGPGEARLDGRLSELIGDQIVIGDDGLRLWFPTPGRGGWSPWALRVIADWMDRLDEPWRRQLDQVASRGPKVVLPGEGEGEG